MEVPDIQYKRSGEQPGEVLVSSTVKDLVAGSEIRFEDRGLDELKGVGEWRLYAVGELLKRT